MFIIGAAINRVHHAPAFGLGVTFQLKHQLAALNRQMVKGKLAHFEERCIADIIDTARDQAKQPRVDHMHRALAHDLHEKLVTRSRQRTHHDLSTIVALLQEQGGPRSLKTKFFIHLCSLLEFGRGDRAGGSELLKLGQQSLDEVRLRRVCQRSRELPGIVRTLQPDLRLSNQINS